MIYHCEWTGMGEEELMDKLVIKQSRNYSNEYHHFSIRYRFKLQTTQNSFHYEDYNLWSDSTR